MAFLQKAVGDDVEVRQGITGYVATSGDVSIGWIGRPLEGKTGDTLVAEAMDLMQVLCDKPSLQMSAIARQNLDGIRVLRQSFECRNFGPISQYGEVIVLEDGDRFETFYNGALAQQRPRVVKVSDGIVRVLVEMYR